MADVGVLNLQIHDNSEQAVQGLDKLTDALTRVKTAVSGGLKLGKIATDLERIGKVVDDSIHGSTIVKISQLGEALSQLKGLENVRITIKDGGNSVQIRDALGNSAQLIDTISQTSQTMASEMTEGFGQAAAGVRQATEAYEDMKDRMAEAKGAGNGLDFSVFDPSKLPLDALGMKIDESGQQWRQYGEMVKDSFDTIKNAGALDTVTSSVEEVGRSTMAIIPYNENLENSWERISARMDEAKQKAAEYEAIRKEQEAKFYAEPEKKEYTMAQTNAMADNLTQLDLLKAKLREAEEQYNKFVNALGTDSAKTVAAGLKVSDLRDKIWEYNDALKQANATATTSGLDKVTEYMDASKIDLLTEKYNAMQTALAQDIQNGQVDTQTAIDRAVQIKNLGDQIQNLKEKEDEAASSTHGLRSAFESLKTGIKNLSFVKLLSQFARIAKYRFLRSVIRSITSGFSEGIQNVYNYSKAINSSFAPSMDSAASSLAQMKNSIGAATAPLLQALIPVLQTVVNWFITAINYVNQFIALLNGQTTWTRAVYNTTSAYKDQTKAAKSASAAVKDLLADWDELNIIQSQNSGGGTGSTSAAEDYLKMFEEVSKFDSKVREIVDFLKENMETVKNIVADIGLAILAWKLSSAFTGWLSTLATIATVGFIIKLAFDASTLLDEAYVESNDIGYLIGDTVMTAALAGIAGKLMSAKFGEGAGLITAGLTFAVSAGATFYVAKNVQNETQKKMLDMLGGIKMGIGMALAIAGFIKSGVNPLVAIIAGVVSVGLITEITMSLKIQAEEAEKAKDMAKKAFASTGEGGINPNDYVTALQDEFNRQTAGAKLVLDAYVEVPDLKEKLDTAMTQISSFNQIIFHGDGKLTKEDAEKFAEAWGIVIETLNTLNTKRYETILAGLTEALNTKSKELRAEVEEIRTTFIMLEQNISAENAEIYKHMQELTEKMKNGDRSDETLAEYESYYRVFAAATRSGLDEIEKAMAKGKTFDFGDADHAVENAKTFVQQVSEAAAEASKAEEDALSDITESVEAMRRVEQAKYDEHLITEEQYKERMSAFDEIIDVATKYAAEKKAEIEGKAQEAWNLVFEQALSSGNLSESYWKEVLIPLMKEAKEAGYEIPQSVTSAFASGVGSYDYMLDFGTSFDTIISELKDKTADEIARALNDTVEAEFSGKKEGLEYYLTNLLVSHTNLGLSETQVEARDLLGVKGWDYWADDVKLMAMDYLRQVVGDTKAKAVAEKLGFDWSLLVPNAQEAEEAASAATTEIAETVSEASDTSVPPVDTTAYESGLDGLVEDTKEAVSEAKEEIEKLGVFLDWNNEFKISPDLELTNDGRLYLQMMINAVNSGKGLTEIQAASDQALEMFGVQAFIEVLPYINQLMDAWRELQTTSLGDNQASNFRVNGRLIASAGVSDVGYAPYNPQTQTPNSEPTKVQEDNLAADIESGAKAANGPQNELLTTLINLCTRIANKEWVININPNSSWGNHNARSQEAWERVNG